LREYVEKQADGDFWSDAVTDAEGELYRTACGMTSDFNVTLRHAASGAKFERRMTSPTLLVGADRGCDFRLPSSTSSAKELLIQVVGGKIFCLALGESEDESKRVKRRSLTDSGIELNGFEIRAFEEHGPNTEIERLLDLAPPGNDSPLPKGKYELSMRNEGRQGILVPLDRPVIVMGRSPRCGVSFNSWSASRFHAACISTPTGVWVVDLKSRTGTFVNEIPVRRQRLELGDRLRIGPSRFEFRLARGWAEPVESSPVESSPAPLVHERRNNLPATTIDDQPSNDSDVLALVSSLASAISRNQPQETSVVDVRSIVRALNDMLKMQSLQLDEIRRLNAYLAANNLSPQALLEAGDRFKQAPVKPAGPPLKPTGSLLGAGPEPDVHEWFQEGNSETAEERSVAGILKRILGAR
jgi:pSer/pThr/pTyr-binding forkhead associated (FHA) protein